MHTSYSLRIFDEDAYFAAGLRYAIQELYTGGPQPSGLLFFTLNTRRKLPLTLFTSTFSVLRPVCIASRLIIPGPYCPGFPAIPVLHRESRPTARYLRQFLTPPKKASRNMLLTTQLCPREQEVLRYLMHLQPGQVGRILQISEKTVSIVKRKAMKKLGLQNMEGLRQWMDAFSELLTDAQRGAEGTLYFRRKLIKRNHNV
ncbi:helix-turn-helix transcriptional regulator [Serratia ureilytica]|uniref:helix-turn-helix transcriptional regulator n=1 Tax=Serratia ureilytica TaxID=300181 RepID=UPI0034C62D46